MTISDINAFCTFRTGANTTQYSAANRLISTNRWYHKITDMIFESMSDYQHQDLNLTTEAIISKNLVANQGYVDIGLTDLILNIRRVELAYDATNYYLSSPLGEGEVSDSIATQANINARFNSTQPFHRLKGRLLYLYPVPTANATNGLKLWVDREADEFTSAQVTTGTKEPGFDEPYHVMIALGMCLDWYAGKKGMEDKRNDVKAELADYELRLRRNYGGKNADRVMQLKSAFVDYN